MGKITREDRIVIKALRVQKNWSSRRFLNEFPSKAWCRHSLDRLIKKVDAGLPVDGLNGRSRRRPVRSAANIARVEELICSQEDARGTHKSPREIERQTGISRSSVRRIAKLDLNLKTFKRTAGVKLSVTVCVSYDKICITPLLVVCSLLVQKIIEFNLCIQMLPSKM